jgi:hypothetical protein
VVAVWVRRVGGAAAGEREETGAPGRLGGRRDVDDAAGEPLAHRLLRQALTAPQHGRGGRIAAQGAQGRQIVRTGVVTGGEGVLEALQVAGGRTGQGVAVAGEVGDEERAQPACLADRLVDGVGQAQTFPDVVVGQGDGVKGDGEGASEHTQLVRTERHAATGSVWRGHAPDHTC